MSDFELALPFTETVGLVGDQFLNFFKLVLAMLVTATIAAWRLSPGAK